MSNFHYNTLSSLNYSYPIDLSYQIDSNFIPFPKEINASVYYNWISSFERKWWPQSKIIQFVNYMKSECDPNFTNDIWYFIEEYNSIITQSIQAIRSWWSENTVWIQNQTHNVASWKTNKTHSRNIDYTYDNNTRAKRVSADDKGKQWDDNSYVCLEGMEEGRQLEGMMIQNGWDDGIKWLDNNEVKQPLRHQIKMMSKSKSNTYMKPVIGDEIEIPLKWATLRPINKNKKERQKEETGEIASPDNINSFSNPTTGNETLGQTEKHQFKIMQKTNDILKIIESTKRNEKHFVDKYTNCDTSKQDLTSAYKSFIENIINYNYSWDTLENINDDIIKIQHQQPRALNMKTRKKSSEKASNTEHKQWQNTNTNTNTKVSVCISSPSTKLKNNQQYQPPEKPFVQYTRPHGRLFCKDQSSNI